MELSITLVIIIITVLVSIGGFNNQKIIDDLIFYPPAVSKRNQWYRFFSCGLIHADWGHLIFNMYALFLFGAPHRANGFSYGLEVDFKNVFGSKATLLYLFIYVAALAICLIPTYNKNKDNYHYRSLGASGAISAVIFASIMFNPMSRMGLLFVPIYVPGFLFGFIYLAVSSWLARSARGNINHSAHIWGGIFGVVFVIIACRVFSQYPVLQEFIDAIKNTDPSDFIKFGR